MGGRLATPGLTTAIPILLRGLVPTVTKARPSLGRRGENYIKSMEESTNTIILNTEN